VTPLGYKHYTDHTITNVIEGQGILCNMKELKKVKDELQQKLGTGTVEGD
jgi:hypothetical protein